MSWQESLGKNLIKNVEVKIGDNKTIGVDTINTERDYERNDIISVSYKQKKGKTFIIREIIRNMKHIPKGIVFYQQTILPEDDFKIEDFNK